MGEQISGSYKSGSKFYIFLVVIVFSSTLFSKVALARSSSTTSAQSTCENCAPSITSIEKATKPFLDEVTRNVAVGARQAMAFMYQSCEILNKPPYDPDINKGISPFIDKVSRGQYYERRISSQNLPNVVNNHYYLKDLKSKSKHPKCIDIKKSPPIFYFGGRPGISTEGNHIDIHVQRRAGESRVTGLDCSAFVSVSIAQAGLKIAPHVRTAHQNMVTSDMVLNFNSSNSCFESPTFKKGETLQPGDLFAFYGHVLIIDKVGTDPFGIQEMKNIGYFPAEAKDCYGHAPIPDFFDFTVIQSSGLGDMPAMRIKGSQYIRPTQNVEGYLYNRFRDIYEAACIAEFGYEPPVRNRRGTNLARHKGKKDPRCLFSSDERPKILAEDCTGNCIEEALQ